MVLQKKKLKKGIKERGEKREIEKRVT